MNSSEHLRALASRGVTTLEQFAESKAQMRKPQRINSQKAFEERLARSSLGDGSSPRSEIGPPADGIPIVLDGRRVEYSEVARLDGRPLDYVAATQKTGEPALVIFSDTSVMRDHLLKQHNGPTRTFSDEVESALLAGGIEPLMAIGPRLNLGMRIWEHDNFAGSSCLFAPEEYVDNLSEFDEGLGIFGGDWNDKISSIQVARCYCRAWEHAYEGGASLTIYRDTPSLGTLGWNDRISTIWAVFDSTA